MSCEEAWLLATFIRSVAPGATLAIGPIPFEGQDESFPKQANGSPKFTIRAEKCPNRRGIEKIIKKLGGTNTDFEGFIKSATGGSFSAAWIVGGYPKEWVTKELAASLAKIQTVIAQDILPSALTDAATLIVPSCSWAERSGCFINCQDKIQPFDSSIAPLEGCQRDGNYLYALQNEDGLYQPAKVREMMAKSMPEFAALHVPPELPAFAH